MLSQIVEKALDNKSTGALSQADIKAYYDHLDLVLCVRWLLEVSPALLDPCVVIAGLRWQMLPVVHVTTGIGAFGIGRRTGGAITGSRCAGVFGRIPVEESVRHCEAVIKRHGWRAGDRLFGVGCFVDNLFCAGQSLGGSLCIADALERRLRQRWLLGIKASSRQAMPVAGAPECGQLAQYVRDWPGWSFRAWFRCLGMRLDNRGSAIPDFREVRQQVLASVVLNFGSQVKKALTREGRLKVIERVGASIFDYRNSRWPLSPSLARAEDALQRRILLIAHGSARRADEDLDTWQRRRSREAGVEARQVGLWSERHAKRMLMWRAHVERDSARGSMLSHLWHHQNAAWRMSRRERAGSSSSFAGRLDSRVLTHVCPRWEDTLPAT